jgi:DNA-directed RNA polymerase subunit RPC12/RpoP
MTEYIVLQTSDLADNPEQATRECGMCGKRYIADSNIRHYQCLCGSRTLYPINEDDVTGDKARTDC